MARKHLSHIKSKLTENGGPKLPTSSQLIEGEIAVNFAKGYETLSILNSDSGITTFSNDVTIMSYIDGQDLEIVNGAGLSVVSNSQAPGVSNYQYVADSADTILSGATSLKDADSILSQTILDNEVVIARAINDLEENKQDKLSAGTGIDITDNVVSCTFEVEVDHSIDSGSTNPVANSAITMALEDKQDAPFIIECSGDTIPTSFDDSASLLTITNGVTSQDVIDAYVDGKKIAVNFYFYNQDFIFFNGNTIYAELDSISYDSQTQAFGGVGKTSAGALEAFLSVHSDVEFFVSNVEQQGQLNVRVREYLTTRAEVDYSASTAKLVFPGEAVQGDEFKPLFRFDASSGPISPVVAYLDDLDELIDDVKVDSEYFATNGTNSFAASNKRYNIMDVLELESGATYNVGSGSTLHFWNGGALSGDSAVLGIKDTLITGPMHQIFGDNVTFGGTMRNAECYPEWFGALGDGVTDDSAAINRCIYNAGYTPVVLNAMAYYVESSISMTESGFNSLINTQLGYSAKSWGRNQQFIAKHNIIGAPTLDGPVLIVESNGSICRVNGVIAVQNSGDSAVGFSTIKPSGADSGNQDMNIYIHGIQKGPKGDWYEGGTTVDSYVAQWGVGHGTGAVLASYGGFIVIDYIQGFERGVNLCRFYDTQLHIGQCEAIYCLYLGPSYSLGSKGYFVTRNKIFVGAQLKTQGNYCKYIVNAEHSSVIREIGSIEIAMNDITIGDSNGDVNRRHPHKHSLYYTAGGGGHTGNKYNFNITYGVETARTIIKCEYGSAPTGTGAGMGNGDIINFGVSCYLRDIDIPYGWNVKLNNVLVSNTAQSYGSYRWFGGSSEMLIDTVTITKDSTPVWDSSATTIKLLDINPQHKGNVIATDTVPTTCANGKFYVVDNSTVTITTNGTKKYPVYAKYFGTDATLIGYSLDSYKEYQEALTFDAVPTDGSSNPVESNGIYDALEEKQDVLSAGTGIDITDNVISSTLVIDSALDSGSTNPVQNSAITISLNEIEEVVGASLWDLNAKTVDNKRAISALTESLSGMQDCITTTYDELKTMRDDEELKPGVWYRITDYQCTTSQANTSAATHQFDILVLATDTNKLSEEARAVNHSGDTYFTGSTLGAWKVWYCLDNDTDRFAWVCDSFTCNASTPIGDFDDYQLIRDSARDSNGLYGYKLYQDQGNGASATVNFLSHSKIVGSGTYTVDVGVNTNVSVDIEILDSISKGVIYRLIDEWNNDCPYDFKNILFKRPLTNGTYDTGGTDTWCYTFNLTDLQDTSVNLDSSLVWRNYFDVSQTVDGVHDNKILPSTNTDGNESNVYELNGCVFLDIFDQDFFGSYGNIFLQDCRNNTLLDGSVQNIFEEDCKNNIICGCRNHFGQGCSGNEFTLNSIGSYFGRECVNNIGAGVHYCNFGNGCNSNHFSSILSGVTFGNFSSNNSITTESRVTSLVIFENGVEYVDLISNIQVDSQHAGPLKNITIKSGVAGTSASHKVITHPTVNDTFHTTYQPANSQVISV